MTGQLAGSNLDGAAQLVANFEAAYSNFFRTLYPFRDFGEADIAYSVYEDVLHDVGLLLRPVTEG